MEDHTEELEQTEGPSALLKEDEIQSQKEDESRQGVLARIAEIIRGGKPQELEEKPVESDTVSDVDSGEEPDKSNSEDEDEEPTEADDDYEEIDTAFVDAARSYGWSDDRIVKYAESHDDSELVMLTGMMNGQARRVTKDDVVEVPTKETSPYADVIKELEGNTAIGGDIKKFLQSLVTDLDNTKAQLKSLTDGQDETKRASEHNEWLGRLRAADETFDGVAKEFPEIGSTKTLRRYPDGSLNDDDPAVKVRKELFGMALSLHQGGRSWEVSVKDAIRWYRGGRDDVVESNVLKKIKDGAKRISPRREARHQTRKFANEIEEKAAVVNEALRKHGVELPE